MPGRCGHFPRLTLVPLFETARHLEFGKNIAIAVTLTFNRQLPLNVCFLLLSRY